MTKLSGINFSNTNRLHLVLVIKIYFDNNFNYPKVYTSSKTPGQIKFTSQVPTLLNMFKAKYNYIYQIQQGIYKFLLSMWVMFFSAEGVFFPKMEKLTPTIKDKKGL